MPAPPSFPAPLPLTQVMFADTFWAPRIALTRTQTLPFEYEQCKQTGRIDALRLDWRPGQEPQPHIFWESDVAKWLEAASYSLATTADPALEALVAEVIDLLAAAQQPDGYLNVYFTVVAPGNRWTDLRDAHELYCAGHLIEAGVAHFEATGKRSLLAVVQRYADHIDTTFGPGEGQLRGYCGHEEIELALMKLARVTGEQRYARLSQFFVEERGQQPFYFEAELHQRRRPGFFGTRIPQDPAALTPFRQYNQSHAPVREQHEVVGHAVRAMYLYSAMADVAMATGDQSMRAACERLWQHLTTRRLYITGGIGSSAHNEGFTSDYDLPNDRAYAETCAAIGLVFWAQRMAALSGDGCYVDVLELALYNGVLSGISLDGRSFFYANPLASNGDVHRKEWFGCACCPPNIARLLTSLGSYAYAQHDAEAIVNLYVAGSAQFDFGDTTIRLHQQTAYPWAGAVTLMLSGDLPATFTLSLRIPGWCRAPQLQLNGAPVALAGIVNEGYLRLTREWQAGDELLLEMPMPIERIYAHPAVAANRGRVALQRGPLVYCVEACDHDVPLEALLLPRNAQLTAHFEPDLLGGVVVLRGIAHAASWPDQLYQHDMPIAEPVAFTAIPYYAWDNRAPGAMQVWLSE
ncbi:glycoside hydrolase family 127 protein [Candidatus Gracilibacteria bacterium]|nr:glycoside hydrolase family 127 protein [Candidatus Gracilibacteria bacterium]